MRRNVAEFLIQTADETLAIHAQDVVPVIDFLEHRGELAPETFVLPDAKDLHDDVGGQAEHAEFAGAFEGLVDRAGASEDDVATVLHLVQGIRPSEINGGAVLRREFRTDDQRPILEPLPNHLGTECVGDRVQRRHVADSEERIVVLAKAGPGSLQLAGDDVVPVQVVRRLKRQERPDTQDEGAEHLVANVEVVVGVPRVRPSQDAIVGIVGRVRREPRVKRRSLFQAFQDEVHAESLPSFETRTVPPAVIVPFQSRGFQRRVIRPFDRNTVVPREGLDPLLVLLRALPQRLFRDRVDPVDVAEKMDDVLLARQEREVALNNDAIETVGYKDEQAAKQLVEGVHRSSPVMRASATQSSVRRLVETRSFDHRCWTGAAAFDAPPLAITKGSALEISALPIRSVAGRPRDFKGGALGYI